METSWVHLLPLPTLSSNTTPAHTFSSYTTPVPILSLQYVHILPLPTLSTCAHTLPQPTTLSSYATPAYLEFTYYPCLPLVHILPQYPCLSWAYSMFIYYPCLPWVNLLPLPTFCSYTIYIYPSTPVYLEPTVCSYTTPAYLEFTYYPSLPLVHILPQYPCLSWAYSMFIHYPCLP